MEKKQSSIDILIKAILESDVELYISMQESGEFEQIKELHKAEQEVMFECGRNFQLTGEGTFNEVYNEAFGETKN